MKEKLARRATLLSLLGLGMITQLGEAFAQETIQKAPISAESTPELGQPGESTAIISVPSIDEWQQIKTDVSANEVSSILEMAGWNKDVAAEEFETLSQDDRFSLYSRNVAAGVSDFLVVPKNAGQMLPLEFRSAASSGIIQANWLTGSGGMISAQEIRDEIITGMQAAIDSLCGMRARPSEIKAKASAVGIVEIEATWVSAEVCIES